MHKVFVIGLDGANLDLVLKWKDELPNLRRLMEGGVFGRLESSIPFVTSPAWNCMFTGKNPGKIGIFGLQTFPINKKTELSIVNYSNQDSPSVWDLLGRRGKTVVVVNVPTCSTPTRVNGCMVCGGLLTSPRNIAYTFPPGMAEQLDRVANGYERMPLVNVTLPGKEKEMLGKFRRNIEKQKKAVKWLNQEFDWDFMVYVIYPTDTAQHCFWHHMDDTHPMHSPKKSARWKDAIKETYKMADAAIGELLADLPADTNVLVTSDHGFGPLFGYFSVNDWLAQQGLLRLAKRRPGVRYLVARQSDGLRRVIERYGGPGAVAFIVRVMPDRILKAATRVGKRERETDYLENTVDWAQTKAYSVGTSPGIFINLRGREDKGIVDPDDYDTLRQAIMELLLDAKDPRTGRKVVEKVFKREDLYSGEHLDMAPDIVYVPNGYDPRSGIGHKSFCHGPRYSGTHRLHGTFIACGPDIRSAAEELPSLRIYDITPTILHLLDCPIPVDVDGHVLTDIFAEGSEPANRSIRYQEDGAQQRLLGRIEALRNSRRI